MKSSQIPYLLRDMQKWLCFARFTTPSVPFLKLANINYTLILRNNAFREYMSMQTPPLFSL